MNAVPRTFDIFCRVVDNHGDAGVCWRLAQLLAHEHGCRVTLWIDERAALAAFVAGARDPAATMLDGIALRSLADTEAHYDGTPDVVVEAFGCGLPAACLDVLERRRHVWIVLEYLSAEAWVDGFHGLPSPHPTRPLTRWFWFPGFTAATGGLLREAGVPRADVASAAPAKPDSAFVFCYDNPALAGLLDAWAAGPRPLTVRVPERVAARTLAAWLGRDAGPAGTAHRRGALVLEIVGWTDQRGFDDRLRASAFNVVRGEDSFVRAQWAARPMLWHIYRQLDDAHRGKLDAFLARYLEGLPADVAAPLRALALAFDREDARATAAAWPAVDAAWPALAAHAAAWALRLSTLPELAAGLVEFAKKRYT